jgi:hypothetical protein
MGWDPDVSGRAPFIPVVKTTDLRDDNNPPEFRRLHRLWFRCSVSPARPVLWLRAPLLQECRAAPSSPRSVSPLRGYEPNTQPEPGGRAAGRARRVRQAPVHGQGTSPALLPLGAVSPARRRARPRLRECCAPREAAFRIEPRAPASPALRRAATLRTRSAARPERPAGTARPPDSRARSRAARRCRRAPRRPT